MIFKLTPELLRLGYDLLCETSPFNKWNLPDSHDVVFKLTKSYDTKGHYKFWVGPNVARPHEIAVSINCVGNLASMLEVEAHEMIHMHEELVGTSSPCTMHNKAFKAWAKQVCRIHSFDEKLFV